MNTRFEGAWSDIRRQLLPGTLVRYWSAEEGYVGGAFRVNDVDGAAVIVSFGQAGQERRVSKGEFQRLFASWDSYNRGTIGLAELRRQSENATYIMSILHLRHETQSSAPSPTLRISPAPISSRPETVWAAEPGGYSEYGKQVLHEATQGRALLYGPSVEIDYGAGQRARIDATVGDIAIETGSRQSKQVRGAILDLICHPYPKKLLVLLPDYLTSAETTAEQCRNILKRFCPDDSFRVVVLRGSASGPQITEDAAIVAAVLADLRSR